MENEKKNGVGMGVASMILGILSVTTSCCVPYLPIVLALVGLVLGAAGIKMNSGRGMAIAGLILSIISLIPAIAAIVIGGSIISEIFGSF